MWSCAKTHGVENYLIHKYTKHLPSSSSSFVMACSLVISEIIGEIIGETKENDLQEFSDGVLTTRDTLYRKRRR